MSQIDSTNSSSRTVVNIITGFLGVGKTTAIMHLLKNKPDNEQWAVLVNEFGEVGIDQSLITNLTNASSSTQSQELLIKEIPGGCMCCVNGVPTRVALNALLQQKPDRLLIEPTGLGHPDEIIELLTSEDYCEVVDLRASLTLVDPTKIHIAKYQEHPVYQSQLAIADALVATKTDLAEPGLQTAFDEWVARLRVEHKIAAHCVTYWISRGQLETEWLDMARASCCSAHDHDHDQ